MGSRDPVGLFLLREFCDPLLISSRGTGSADKNVRNPVTKSRQSQILLWLEKVTLVFAARFGLCFHCFYFVFFFSFKCSHLSARKYSFLLEGLISSM